MTERERFERLDQLRTDARVALTDAFAAVEIATDRLQPVLTEPLHGGDESLTLSMVQVRSLIQR